MIKQTSRGAAPIPTRPLCVDLDGTLVATDTLWESVVWLLKHKLHLVPLLPLWIFYGKAYFKDRVAQHVVLDPSCLPYRRDVIQLIIQSKSQGRNIVLASASHRTIVDNIARYLNLFSESLASDRFTNLSGLTKRQVLESRYGFRGFDYVGDSIVDLPVWEGAEIAYAVVPTKQVLTKARLVGANLQVITERRFSVSSITEALRCFQWLKNGLLFVPLLTSHRILEFPALEKAGIAFIAMSLCASGIYLVNDLLDIDVDRKHPRKQSRPFASGALPLSFGCVVSPALVLSAFAVAIASLSITFTLGLGTYVVLTSAYSFLLKRYAIIDVIVLASLYTLRILLGGVVTSIPISTWLLAFSMFLFLSLALVKRFAEATLAGQSVEAKLGGRGYLKSDSEMLKTMGITSGFLSVLVFAFYVSSPEIYHLYTNPSLLWLACPALLYWLSRIWLLASRGQVVDDPLDYAVRDLSTYFTGSFILIILWVASM